MPPKALTIPLRSEGRAAGLEWPAPPGSVTCVLTSSEHGPADWDEFARTLDAKLSLVALPPGVGVDATTDLVPAGEKFLVVAHGEAGRAALKFAAAGNRALAGLVLADFAPGPGSVRPGGLPCPALLLRGRQSTAVSHEAIVRARERLPGSWLIEPEDCGAWPFGSCPEAAAGAVLWFATAVGARQPEIAAQAGDAEAPVDPRQAG